MCDVSRVALYHAGFARIEHPDLRRERANADFGQGFYLSADAAFSRRWARSRRGEDTWLNAYTLALDGLNVRRLARDAEWFDCISRNRAGHADALADYDVIVGPIANDTLYDTWGIGTSGMLGRGQALELMMIGPAYEQTVIKTERAAAALRLVDARILEAGEIAGYREAVRREQEQYQRAFAQTLARLLDA